MIDRKQVIKDYTNVVNQCMKLLDDVDRKHGTYGAIEIRDINVTPVGEIFHQYTRNIEWREIRIQ